MKKAIKIGKIMLIVALIWALASCSGGVPAGNTVVGPSKESVAILNEAAMLSGSLKYKESRKLLQDKYDIIKDNDMALNTYGFMELHIFNNYEKADELLQRAIKLNPKNPKHYIWMGCVYKAKEEYKKAIKYYDKAVKNTTNYENLPFNPEQADLYTNIGSSYLN